MERGAAPTVRIRPIGSHRRAARHGMLLYGRGCGCSMPHFRAAIGQQYGERRERPERADGPTPERVNHDTLGCRARRVGHDPSAGDDVRSMGAFPAHARDGRGAGRVAGSCRVAIPEKRRHRRWFLCWFAAGRDGAVLHHPEPAVGGPLRTPRCCGDRRMDLLSSCSSPSGCALRRRGAEPKTP